MGNSSTRETTIRNKVEVFISTTNEAYAKILNQQFTSVMSTLASTQTAEVDNANSASNVIEISGGTIINSQIDLTQKARAEAVSNALLSLVQNNESITQISNTAQNAIKQKLESDTNLTSDLKFLNSVKSTTETGGEVNAMIRMVNSAFDSITGKDTKDDTTIENEIKQKLITKNITSTDISNIISNTFSTNISTTTLNTCKNTNNVGNTIKITNQTIEGTTIKLLQDAFAKKISNCVISSVISNVYSNLLENLQQIASDQSSTADTTADTKVDTKTDVVSSDITKSFVDIIANNIILVIIIIGVLIAVGVIAFGLPIIKGIFGKKS